MDWGRSYNAAWRVFRVDRNTWADAEKIENIDRVSVTRTTEGNLIESGNFTITGELPLDYYRVVMTAEQNGEVERVDVATMLIESTGGSYDYNVRETSANGRSVLYPASTTAIISGEYAPAGADGAQYSKKLLETVINAPVEVEGSFTLNNHIVHKIGGDVLSAVWSVLDAGNFILQIDGRGIVHIRPRPTEPILILDNNNARLLTNKINYTTDQSQIPNRYIAIFNGATSFVINDSADSPVSTVNRGFFVDMVDEKPALVNGETLGGYLNRKLHEESLMIDQRTYTREFSPDVYPHDIVKASLEGLEGNLRVKSQTLTCGYGITVQESAVRGVYLW